MAEDRKPRIFIGIKEIGDFALLLGKGLRELGFETTTVVMSQLDNPRRPWGSGGVWKAHDRYIYTKGRYDYQIVMLREFLRSLNYDIYVFVYCESFFGRLIKLSETLGYIDLPILKRLGKKIVVTSQGSDIRSHRLLVEEMKRSGMIDVAQYCETDIDMSLSGSDAIKKKRVRRIEKYADYIFARPTSAQFLSRPYKHGWLPVDLSLMKFRVSVTSNPLVVHAPSDVSVKGTKYVLEAVAELRKRSRQFRFVLCENMDNSQVRELLAQSEVVIDQMLIPSYGLLAVEAMASGNVVLGSAIPGRNGFGADLPIITSNPKTICEKLWNVLGDPELRRTKAHEGREYVEKYHDYRKVARRFLNDIGEGRWL